MCVGGKGESGRRRGNDGAVLDEEFGDGEGVGGVLVGVDVGGSGVWGGGGGVGRGRSSRVGSSESEEDGMGISGAVVSVWISAQRQSVENALNIIFLDRSEEGFIRGGVVGLRVRRDRSDESSVDVFIRDKPEALIACCVGGGFDAFVHVGFPDHIADAIADLEEDFDDVGAEGGGVEG